MLLQKHQELNAAQFVCQKPLTLMNADPLYNGKLWPSVGFKTWI